MFGRLSSQQKTYDPTKWQKHITPETLQRVYDDQGWTGLSGQWRQRSLDRLIARISELYQKLGSEVSLLDVACFSGDYFGRLQEQEQLRGQFRYTGVDVTPAYVASAADRWRGCPNAQFREGSALELPVGEGTFDIVFNHGMLIHVDDVERCLREFARVARHYVLVETTVDREQSEPWRERGKSGPEFIDRVYRPDYIRGLLSKVANITKETAVPYIVHESMLFEAVPR